MNMKEMSVCQHGHIFHYTGTGAERRTMRVVMFTLVMMAVEVGAGLAFNSMALLADGWHMGTHAVALGISWVAFVLARRYANDRRFAFGTWKIEVLGGFVSAILLLMAGLGMAGMSIGRLIRPGVILFDQAIIVAVVGLVVNMASIVMLRGLPHIGFGGHHHDHDAHNENPSLKAAYYHVLADAMTSVFAIAALLGGKFLDWYRLDPLMGIAGSILVLRWTQGLLADTGGILLDREGGGEIYALIREVMEKEGNVAVRDLHVWRVGQDKYACIIGIAAAEPRPSGEYRRLLAKIDNLVHVTIEVVSAGEAQWTMSQG